MTKHPLLDYEQNPVLFLLWSYHARIKRMLPDSFTRSTRRKA